MRNLPMHLHNIFMKRHRLIQEDLDRERAIMWREKLLESPRLGGAKLRRRLTKELRKLREE